MLCNRDLLRDMAASVASVLLELVGWSSKDLFIFIFKVGFIDWQCCSDEYVHIAEEQAHPQYGGHRHILPGQASPETFSFSYIDVTVLGEPLLVKKSLQWENVNSSNLIKIIAGKSLPMHWLSTNFGKLEAIHRPMGSHCPARGAAVKSKDWVYWWIHHTEGWSWMRKRRLLPKEPL